MVSKAAKKALIASRSREVGIQCNLTGSLLVTSFMDDDDDDDEEERRKNAYLEEQLYQDMKDIQASQEHSKKVRRLHHWHAMSGSADLLEKNPGAYEYLLQRVEVEPKEAKAIVRDARCTYAVTSMNHKRSPSFNNKEKNTGDGGGESKSSSSSSPMHELTPFASSLCNVLSCFCRMLDMKFISGMNYIAGYCLLVCCGDEEASFWLFVAIYKKVKILFDQSSIVGSTRVMVRHVFFLFVEWWSTFFGLWF
tara:strand:+ start:57 stop:809 length:753 start_codon:yes stop_codon:yes gene_type:complete